MEVSTCTQIGTSTVKCGYSDQGIHDQLDHRMW